MTVKIGCLAIICGLILLLLCGVGLAQEEPTPSQTGEQPLPTSQTEGEPTPGNVYFYLNGELSPVNRDLAGGAQTAEFGMIELLKGPSEEEKAAGYITYIPEGVKLQYSTIKMDYSAYDVNLSRELLELSGDKDRATKALAQIEKTLQGITSIENIGIFVAGEGLGSEPEDAYIALGVTAKGVEEAAETGGGSNTGLIIIIVIVVLAVALLVLLIIYIPSRRKKTETKTASNKKKAKKRAKR